MFDLLVKLQRKLQLMILSEQEICDLLWGGFYWGEERNSWGDKDTEQQIKVALEEICPRR